MRTRLSVSSAFFELPLLSLRFVSRVSSSTSVCSLPCFFPSVFHSPRVGTHVISVCNEGAPPLASDIDLHHIKSKKETRTSGKGNVETGSGSLSDRVLWSSSSSRPHDASSGAASRSSSSSSSSSGSPSSAPSYSLAVVVRSGSSTARGSLLRRTLFPSLFLFKYDGQLPAVFLIMLAYAAVVIGVVFKFSPNATGVAGWFYAMGSLSQLLPVRQNSSYFKALGATSPPLETSPCKRKRQTLSPGLFRGQSV